MTDNSQPRILYVTRPLTPPWDEASKNFAKDLSHTITDHDITILTAGHAEAPPSNVTTRRIYTNTTFTLWQKCRLLWFLFFYAGDYDTIHLLFTPTKTNARILKWLIPHHIHTIQTVATVREDLYTPNEYDHIFFADTLVTYSKHAEGQLRAHGFTNVTQIYPGIDLTSFYPTAKDEELMEHWQIAPRDFIVAYPGEFARLGATDLIIDAFLEIWSNPDNAHIKYLCACRLKNNADIAKKSEVRERVRRAGHLDKIIFTDTFPDLNKIYNLADLIIFPVVTMLGKFDVPLAMIEPYACKKVVVASDLPLFGEFSTDEINVIIPRNSSRDITDAILSISQNSSKHVRSGELAYNFVHRTFDIVKIAYTYSTLYENIAKQRDTKPQ